MSINYNTHQEILDLQPLEKIKLIDELLLSLDIPDLKIDEKWKEEVEDRIQAYNENKIKSVSMEDVFSKYD